MIEVTITHNLEDSDEVIELHRRHLIALDWGRQGSDPAVYFGRAKTDVTLYNRMKDEGAAVIAAYKKASCNGSTRLIGSIVPGTQFEDLKGLLCLPLSHVREVDVAANFLGNLSPNRCTIQTCSVRSQGRLAAVVSGIPVPRTVGALHHRDVEWLVMNYMVRKG